MSPIKDRISDMYQQPGICVVQYCHNLATYENGTSCEEHQYKFGVAYMLKIPNMDNILTVPINELEEVKMKKEILTVPIKYICDYCNKYEFESSDGALVQQKMLEHAETHKHTLFNDIIDFHKKFELYPLQDKPHLLSTELQDFRVKFLQEELEEFKDAYFNNDLEKAFDALIDLTYVALGTSYLMGLPFNNGWKEVHHCNMQKIRTKVESDSKRNSSYDVIKPEGWKSPDLSKLVHNKCLVCGAYHGDNMPCPELEVTCE